MFTYRDKSIKQISFVIKGTNVDAAKKILKESGLPIQSASDLDDAAKKAVASI